MLKVGVLGYVVPLLFGFDPTHEGAKAGAPAPDASAVASIAAAPEEATGGQQRDAGPAYLGLGTSRSNIQASPGLML